MTPNRNAEPDERLNAWHREILSANAVRIYEQIYFRMAARDATEVSIKNDELSRRSRVPMWGLDAALSELSSANVLMIDPRADHATYFFADVDAEAER
jgi:hypothetical protein